MEEQQELPKGWEITKLDEVMLPVRGIAFPKEVKAHAPAEGHIACLRTTNVQRKVEWGDLWFIPRQYAKREDQIIQPLDILISTANSYELVGKVAQVHAIPHESTLGAFISLLRVKAPFDAKFFYHYLSASSTQEAIRGFASTTTNISNVSTGKLATLDVVVPPLPDQRRIVAKLEELFSKLDAGVAAVRRTQALLKRYRQSVLHAAVTGELTHAWREAHPASPAETGAALLQRIRAERRAQWEAVQVAKRGGQLPLGDGWKSKYMGPEAVDAVGLPELPEGWVWASVEQLVSVGTGATPLKGNPLYHSEGTVPWVTSGALNHLFIREAQQFITELAVEETNAKVFPAGTLLVAMYGEGKTRGKVSELTFDAATNQACAALIFDDASMDVKEMVKLFFEKNYDDLRRLSSGGVQPNLNLSLIKATAVPLPPLAEQAEIVAEVERRLTVLDALSQTLTDELTRAERLRQSILHRAFTGRLVPQDTTDEPAAALLARLRETPAVPVTTKAGRGRKAVAQQTTLGL